MSHFLQCSSQSPGPGGTCLHQYSIAREPARLNFGRRPGGRIAGLLVGVIGVIVAGCSVSPPSSGAAAGDQTNFPRSGQQAVALTPTSDWGSQLQVASHQLQRQALALVPPADPITVQIYRLDNQCNAFVPEPLIVSRQHDLTDTIAAILTSQPMPHLDLSGYRVSRDNATGTVTIDLRVSSQSRRVLMSLSICEQMALFGSLRRTLLNHPDWHIQDVTITNRGVPLLI